MGGKKSNELTIYPYYLYILGYGVMVEHAGL